MEIKEQITIKADGSGESVLSLIVDKTFVALVVPDLKQQMKKEIPDAVVSVEDAASGNKAVVGRRIFKNVSDLRGGIRSYFCEIQKDGVLRTQYIFEGRRPQDRFRPEAPVPVEITVKFPGSVDKTNGEKIDSQTIRWQWVAGPGGRDPETLSAISVVTAFPLVAVGVATGVVLLLAVGLGIFFLRRKKCCKIPVVSGPAAQTQPKEGEVFCTECGKRQSVTVKFCTSCGNRMGAE